MQDNTETGTADRKPHLSVSQLNMIERCPESWRRRYAEGHIIPPRYAMVRGKSMHAAAEMNFRQKTETGTDLPVRQIVDLAVANFEAYELRDGILLAGSDLVRGATAVRSDEISSTVKLTRLHAALQAPQYEPAAVEETVRVHLPNQTHDLVTVIDLVDKSGAIVDFKTATKAMRSDEADSSIQLTAYHFAWTIRTGIEPPAVVFDVAIDGGETQRRQLLRSERDRDDWRTLAARFTAATRMIQAGVFNPAPAGSWYCSESSCGYYASCPFVRRGHRRGQVAQND